MNWRKVICYILCVVVLLCFLGFIGSFGAWEMGMLDIWAMLIQASKYAIVALVAVIARHLIDKEETDETLHS